MARAVVGEGDGLSGEVAEFGGFRGHVFRFEVGADCLKVVRLGDDEKDLVFDAEVVGSGLERLILEYLDGIFVRIEGDETVAREHEGDRSGGGGEDR